MQMFCAPAASPCEVFPPWHRAQLAVERRARESLPSPDLLRSAGFLRPSFGERVAEWFTAPPTTPSGAVRDSYRALEQETARLFAVALRLGVRVEYVYAEDDRYGGGAELCADLRRHGSMTLRTIACEEPHLLLGGEEAASSTSFASSMTFSATRRSGLGSTSNRNSPAGCSAGRCSLPPPDPRRSASSSERSPLRDHRGEAGVFRRSSRPARCFPALRRLHT